MQEFQVFDWAAIASRLRSKRVLFYILIPVSFVAVWGLTFGVKTYFDCTISIAPETMHVIEHNRVMTLNRPENYDLGWMQTDDALSPEDYDQIFASTEFICRLLTTPVATADGTFSGTYYEYLATRYQYPLHKTIMRWLRGKKPYSPSETLPTLDPFYLKGRAIDAVVIAEKNISCTINRRTHLLSITSRAQDPLVAAMVAQAIAEHLEEYLTNYHHSKLQALCESLSQQISLSQTQYEQAMQAGDQTRAGMYNDAYMAFQRQYIILQAQIEQHNTFLTVRNPSVPSEKAGPHHIIVAAVATIVIALLTMLIVCWKELFGV